MLGGLLLFAAVAGAPSLSAYPEAARSGDSITIAAGSTAIVTIRIPITGPPTPYAQVLVRSTGWTGIADVLAMGEIVATNERPSSADVAVLISVNAATRRPAQGALRIVVNDPNIGRRVGETTWRPTLITPPAETLPAVDQLARQLKDARSELNTAVSSLGPIASQVRKNGMVMLRPDTAQRLAQLIDVTHALGQVQALSAQLRAIGLKTSNSAARAAVRALAANRGPALHPTSRLLERTSAQDAVDRAEALLNRLQLERAIGWADALIDSSRLDVPQLARALVLRATALALGGFEEEAKRGYGQASCLDPSARPPSRPIFQEMFQTLALPSACASPLKARGVTASRAAGSAGVVLTVTVTYGPDPFGLVQGGRVQLLNADGRVIATQGGAAEPIDDQPALVAEFIDDGTLANPAGQLNVSASLNGPGRVAVAEVGVPQPVPVEVGALSSSSGGGLPLWAWIAIGVVAAGGATAAAIAASQGSSDVQRGIGPIDVRF